MPRLIAYPHFYRSWTLYERYPIPDCSRSVGCRADPCSVADPCGRNAICENQGSRPVCRCEPGTVGDPFQVRMDMQVSMHTLSFLCYLDVDRFCA